MIKSGIPIFVVESVERVVKFYTEKLAFDIVELSTSDESKHVLTYAELRKGKCFILFRTPVVEELADFSMIKRCVHRAAGIYIVIKKGFDKYFQRCEKKKVAHMSSIKVKPSGERFFVIKDPFGIRLMFVELTHAAPAKSDVFLGMKIQDKSDKTAEDMIKHLKNFGILRRAAKKYTRLWLKTHF